VCIDGGLNAQTIRLEGIIGSRAVGLSSIIARYAGSECICGCVEEPFSGQFSSVEARFPMRGAAVLARELARLPWSAIGLSRLKLRAAGKATPGSQRFGPSVFWQDALWLYRGCAGILAATYQVDKTLEQLDEPVSGHSDGGDDGEGDEPGDEAVFDGGRAVLVAQKLPKHSRSPEL
jgi:hypothetical protein